MVVVISVSYLGNGSYVILAVTFGIPLHAICQSTHSFLIHLLELLCQLFIRLFVKVPRIKQASEF